MVGKRRCFLVCVLALWLTAGGVLATDSPDPMARVMDMAQKLAQTDRFTVSIRMNYDVRQDNGQKIQFDEIRNVVVARPNRLRVDATQSDGDVNGLIYDGKTLVQFSTTDKVYARLPRPGDLDSLIHYAVSRLGIRIPLARMLVTTFPDELRELTTDIAYVERDSLGPGPTDHIAGRTPEVDYQVWIGEDHLPRRIVLTYKNDPGQPQFEAEFSHWNLAPTIPAGTFVFSTAKDAEEIPVLIPVPRDKQVKKEQGGAS